MDIYAELGVETVINAAGTLTTQGGSLILPQVTDAMVAASRAFVDMRELHLAAGQRFGRRVAKKMPEPDPEVGLVSPLLLGQTQVAEPGRDAFGE